MYNPQQHGFEKAHAIRILFSSSSFHILSTPYAILNTVTYTYDNINRNQFAAILV